MIWDVTVQQDFVSPSGKLPVPAASAALAQIAMLLAEARTRGVRRLSIVCEHRLEDPAIALRGWNMTTTFPPHCLRGTPGTDQAPEVRQEFAPLPIPAKGREAMPLREDARGDLSLLMRGFDPFSEPKLAALLEEQDPAVVLVCGLPLELAVRTAVEGLLQRGRKVRLVQSALAALKEDAAAPLLEAWKAAGAELWEGAVAGPAADPLFQT